VDTEAWKLEAEHIPEHFQTFHRHLPARLWDLHPERAPRLGCGAGAPSDTSYIHARHGAGGRPGPPGCPPGPGQARSKIAAMPWPPPMHMVTSA
jgi:hypothetical protein